MDAEPLKPSFVSECGRVILYQGDCIKILSQIKADAVVTDPPYGYNYESNYVNSKTTAQWMRKPILGDSDTSLRDLVLAWADKKPWACFGSWKMSKPQKVRAVLIWDKGPASGMGDLSFPWKGSWEEIYISGQEWNGFRDEGVIKGHWVVTRASMGRLHPNEKPVSLMGHLINKLTQEITVLDPFMGSGTTGIACIRTGRRFIGIEKDPAHYLTALTRIKNELAQGDLFL